MFGKRNRPQTFEEYIASISKEHRLAIMNCFSKHGDPNEILEELSSIKPCCQSKKLEVRINQNYILWYQKETTFKPLQVYFYKMDAIKYCYCNNPCTNWGSVGWVDTSGYYKSFSSGLENSEIISIFRELQRYVPGFEQLPSLDKRDGILLPSYDHLHFYFFDGNTLYMRKHGEITKNTKDIVVIEDIQDAIWCDQWYAPDSETLDTYALDIYLLSAKKPVCLFADSEESVFEIALALKNRVPHLMYGPYKEYRQIFRRNPAELMALAKSRQQLRDDPQ